jgi:hypothetical protein
MIFPHMFHDTWSKTCGALIAARRIMPVMADDVDNALIIEILKEIRKEQRDHRTLLLLTSERVDRLDRHIEEKVAGG